MGIRLPRPATNRIYQIAAWRTHQSLQSQNILMEQMVSLQMLCGNAVIHLARYPEVQPRKIVLRVVPCGLMGSVDTTIRVAGGDMDWH